MHRTHLEWPFFDAAHRTLTALHGIGPWTADIYLLFCLGHADAWPAGDLALQEAAKLLLELKARPTPKEMTPLAEIWRPWRGAAAYMLWTYYRTLKQRDGAPIQAVPDATTNAPEKPTPFSGKFWILNLEKSSTPITVWVITIRSSLLIV